MGAKNGIKEEPTSSDDEVPLASRKRKKLVPKGEPQSEGSESEAAVNGNSGEDSDYKNSDDDVPLSKRKAESDSDDEIPLASRKRKGGAQKIKKQPKYDSSDEENVPKKKKIKKEPESNNKKVVKRTIVPPKGEAKPGKKPKKEKEPDIPIWKWWLEDKLPEGQKWRSLSHSGPAFPEPYDRLPDHIKFKYDGKVFQLSERTEENMSFFAKMLDHDYTTKVVFRKNFFDDLRKLMTQEEREVLKKLELCDFSAMHQYYLEEAAKRKNRTKEEKEELKAKNKAIADVYGLCKVDGHIQKVGNFRIEPPGLFRGRGDHPKQGKIKLRTPPESIIINIGKGETAPKCPEGHKWKAVQHDNKVTWLACWKENVLGNFKYVMLNPTSKLKGEKDHAKYETARNLKNCVEKIRENYRADFQSKEMMVRQRAVALYFIDKLALRAGNEKDDDEADTVGCCSLRVEHIKLHEKWEDKEFVVEFDFLGKDSIRYQNWVAVNKRVYKNLKIFVKDKEPGDDLFDRLNTSKMNEYLGTLMDGLTAKVFRTYNASWTLQQQLQEQTDSKSDLPNLVLTYNRANRAVAVLCNHQRAAPKTFDKQMENLGNQKDAKKEDVAKQKGVYKEAKNYYRHHRNNDKAKKRYEIEKRKLERLQEALLKLQVKETDKAENKTIALGTSKLNYLDPRITVAWTKRFTVPIEKVYNKTQREKFLWAIEMATADFEW